MVGRALDGNTTVVLDDGTKTKDDRGLFGLDKQYMSNIVLIPGLKVRVDGLVARKVSLTIRVSSNSRRKPPPVSVDITSKWLGHADAIGSAEINTKLSEDRAKAVVALLIQQGGVPVRRVVAPRAMGECRGAAPNETAAGRGENRRVEANVLLDEGIAGN